MGRWGKETGVVSSWAISSDSPHESRYNRGADASGARSQDRQQDVFQGGQTAGRIPGQGHQGCTPPYGTVPTGAGLPLPTAASSSVGGDSWTHAGDTGGHTETPAQASSSEGPHWLLTGTHVASHSPKWEKSDNHEEMEFGKQAKASTTRPSVVKGVPGGMRRHPRVPHQTGDRGRGSRGPVPIDSRPWLRGYPGVFTGCGSQKWPRNGVI